MGEPGPCFDLHFDRFNGLMFKAENPFENVCTTTGLPSMTLENPAAQAPDRLPSSEINHCKVPVNPVLIKGFRDGFGWGAPQNPPKPERIKGFCDAVCAPESTSFGPDKEVLRWCRCARCAPKPTG